MPRDLKAGESQRRARARREGALARNELRQETTPRTAAAGPTSHAVKAKDPVVIAAIEAFLKKKDADNG